MAVEFSFGQIEAVCADLNHIAADKRVAFVSRLKQLQKQRLIDPSARPGRGRAGAYSFGDLMRFVIAVELIQAGIMPQMAAGLVNGSWDLMRINIYTCSFSPEETIGFHRKPTEYLWMIRPEALRGLTTGGEGEWDYMDRISAVSVAEASQQLAMVGASMSRDQHGETWRTLVLNGYGITQRVMNVVAFHFGYASRAEMRDSILAEIHDFDEDMKKFSESLENSPPPTEEQKARMRKMFGDMDGADWRTSPPTPRHVLIERAKEMIPLLPDDLKEFLRGPHSADGIQLDVEISRENLKQLIDLDVFDVGPVDDAEGSGQMQGLLLTPFGRTLIKQIAGPWALEIEIEERAPPPDPVDQQADDIIQDLSGELVQAIKGRDQSLFQEPIRSELLALGLVEFKEADFPFAESAAWTRLGRAVSFALRFGRHRSIAEKKLGLDGTGKEGPENEGPHS